MNWEKGFKRVFLVWVVGWTPLIAAYFTLTLTSYLGEELTSERLKESLLIYVGYAFLLPGILFVFAKAIAWIRDGFRS